MAITSRACMITMSSPHILNMFKMVGSKRKQTEQCKQKDKAACFWHRPVGMFGRKTFPVLRISLLSVVCLLRLLCLLRVIHSESCPYKQCFLISCQLLADWICLPSLCCGTWLSSWAPKQSVDSVECRVCGLLPYKQSCLINHPLGDDVKSWEQIETKEDNDRKIKIYVDKDW